MFRREVVVHDLAEIQAEVCDQVHAGDHVACGEVRYWVNHGDVIDRAGHNLETKRLPWPAESPFRQPGRRRLRLAGARRIYEMTKAILEVE